MEVHSIGLYCTGNGREIKKKSINFTATVFSPGGSSGAKSRRKRAPTSLKSPSSVVPVSCIKQSEQFIELMTHCKMFTGI